MKDIRRLCHPRLVSLSSHYCSDSDVVCPNDIRILGLRFSLRRKMQNVIIEMRIKLKWRVRHTHTDTSDRSQHFCLSNGYMNMWEMWKSVIGLCERILTTDGDKSEWNCERCSSDTLTFCTDFSSHPLSLSSLASSFIFSFYFYVNGERSVKFIRSVGHFGQMCVDDDGDRVEALKMELDDELTFGTQHVRRPTKSNYITQRWMSFPQFGERVSAAYLRNSVFTLHTHITNATNYTRPRSSTFD